MLLIPMTVVKFYLSRINIKVLGLFLLFGVGSIFWRGSPPINYLMSLASLIALYGFLSVILNGLSPHFLGTYLKYLVIILGMFLLFDRVCNFIFGVDIFYLFHANVNYRPGLFLSHDTNWSHGFLLFMAFYGDRLKKSNSIMFFVLFLILLDAARIHMLLWLVYMYVTRINWRTLLLWSSALLILLLWFGRDYIDSDFSYDLVDLDRNPRLNDIIAYTSIMGDNISSIFFGYGPGSIWIIGQDISWRDPVYFVNNLLLQLFVEIGVLGVTFFYIILRRYNRLVLLFLGFCIFHNILFKPIGIFTLVLGNIVTDYERK